MKTQRCRGFQGEMTPSAAKGTWLDFTRPLRMASIATPPRPLLWLVNLNFRDDEFINSFIVYELFLSYNEDHETRLFIDEVQER